jgi:hypothetical protein
MSYTPHPSHPSCFHHSNNSGEAYNVWSSLFCSFLQPPLRSKYSTQHSVFKHPLCMFFPLHEGLSFTPEQNKGQNYT